MKSIIFLLSILMESPPCEGSLSCSLSDRSCVWSCRLRGHVSGACDEDGHCVCGDPVSAGSVLRYWSDKWSASYPDLSLVTDLVSTVSREYEHSCSQHEDTSDHKWRPFSLALGVLYKVQQQMEKRDLKPDIEFYEDSDGNEMTEMLGYFWHLIRAADSSLRSGLKGSPEWEIVGRLEANKVDYAGKIDVAEEDVVHVWSGEMSRDGNVSSYTPDHVITLLHSHKLIMLTILGTQVFPSPQPLDILMDLMADTRPFLGGRAHSGISMGAENIVKEAGPVLRDMVRLHPDYQILILGYSLGAGLAQLVALDCSIGECRQMLPERTVIRTIGFGSPPVFTMTNISHIPIQENLILVQNDNDGISGASLKNVHDMMDQVCHIKSLNIKRRSMLKLLFTNFDNDGDFAEDEIETIRFEYENPGSNDGFTYEYDEDLKDEDLVSRISNSLQHAQSLSRQPELYHLAGTIVNLQRQEDGQIDILLSKGQENVAVAEDLRLDKRMMIDHLPQGGYNSLFFGVGGDSNLSFDINILDKLSGANNRDNSHLTNDQSQGRWSRFKNKVKDFFKGLG